MSVGDKAMHRVGNNFEMTMDEPKKTKQAVNAAIWCGKELLVIGRKKWISEGTPWLMPGGGVNDGEKLIDAIHRELNEEVGGWPELYGVKEAALDLFAYSKKYATEWTDNLYIYEFSVTDKYEPRIDRDKFFGCMWLDTEDTAMLKLFWLQLMPGLQKYLRDELNFDAKGY